MKRFFIIFLVSSFVLLSGCSFWESIGLRERGDKEVKPGSMKIAEIPVRGADTRDERVPVESVMVILKTNMGDIKVDFFHTQAPRTVMNFVNLAKADFYDGTKFHRVIKDFMIQGGDPNSKDDDRSDDGQGGPGYTFADEINPRTLAGLDENDIKKLEAEGYVYNYDLPSSHNMVRGMMVMANSGPNTNGSQFFIMVGEEAPWLDGRHTVFGQVVEGMDIVDAINAVETDETDYPKEDIILEDVVVIINGKVFGNDTNETNAGEESDSSISSDFTESEEIEKIENMIDKDEVVEEVEENEEDEATSTGEVE